MTRIQGIWTDCYGRKDYNKQDKSYIATKWFVFFLLPIIPLKAYRLRKVGRFTNKNYIVYIEEVLQYELLSEIPLSENRDQIVKTYLGVYGLLGLFVGSIMLAINNPDSPEFILAPVAFTITFLIWYLIRH